MMRERPLFLPVLLATPGMGQISEQIADFVLRMTAKRGGILTQLLDIRKPMLSHSCTEAESADLRRALRYADALILIVPEYGNNYANLLQRLIEPFPKECAHKVVGLCTLSLGGYSEQRVATDLLPTLREAGLTVIAPEGNFSNANALYTTEGYLRETVGRERLEPLLHELTWMAQTLRYGREHLSPREVLPLAA